MVALLEEPSYRKIKENVEHQGIGGKEISLERVMIFDDVVEMNTIAACNFVNRRPDLLQVGLLTDADIDKIKKGELTMDEFNKQWNDYFDNFKIYYGHVGNLGYFVAEDELEPIE